MKRLSLYIVLVLLAVAGIYWWKYGRAQNIEMTEIVVSDINGETAHLSSLTKGPSIVHFYASWCGPCLKELPNLIEFAKSHQEEYNVVLITDDEPNKLHRVIRMGEGAVMVRRVESLKDQNIYTIPATYFVNSNEILEKEIGEIDWSSNEKTQEIKQIFNP